MANDVLIEVEGVRKKFCRSLKRSLWYGAKDMVSEALGGASGRDRLRPGEFWAVDGVSFQLKRGQCLGLIGRNGAGKTTLLKMLNGLIKPDAGRITLRGRVGALIALGAGFNPILTGRENIYVNGSVLGLSTAEIDEKFDDIVDFAGLRDVIDTPVQSYSSGMQVRLGFSVATALEPDVLLLDEVLAVGDRQFRSKCMSRVAQILDRAAVIFVSHGEGNIQQICDSVLWLEGGKSAFAGETEIGLRNYSRAMRNSTDAYTNYHPPITAARLSIPEPQVQLDGELTLKLAVTASETVHADYFVGTIVAETGESVAQFTWPEREIIFHPSAQTISVTAQGLRLAPGNYFVNVLCCANKGKRPLLHIIYGATFESVGGSVLWAAYQPQATIGQRHGS